MTLDSKLNQVSILDIKGLSFEASKEQKSGRSHARYECDFDIESIGSPNKFINDFLNEKNYSMRNEQHSANLIQGDHLRLFASCSDDNGRYFISMLISSSGKSLINYAGNNFSRLSDMNDLVANMVQIYGKK